MPRLPTSLHRFPNSHPLSERSSGRSPGLRPVDFLDELPPQFSGKVEASKHKPPVPSSQLRDSWRAKIQKPAVANTRVFLWAIALLSGQKSNKINWLDGGSESTS